jgi:hypothetical protein
VAASLKNANGKYSVGVVDWQNKISKT